MTYALEECENDDDQEFFWNNMINGMRNSAMIRASRGRNEAGRCELTTNDLITMYKKQCGRCFYSGIPMTLQSSTSWKASPERLDNDKGYVEGNVVLSCLEFNGFHKMSYARVQQMIENSQRMYFPLATYDALKCYWQRFQDTYATKHSLDHFTVQYIKQNGRCRYSGVPLIIDWSDDYDRPFLVEKKNEQFELIINALWISQNCLWSESKFSQLRYHFTDYRKPEEIRKGRRNSI